MSVKMFFSCYLQNSVNLSQSFKNLVQRRTVELVIAAIDAAHHAAAIDYERGRVRDVERVGG